MTHNGQQCLKILGALEKRKPKPGWFTAAEITAKFKDLPHRSKPVMTVSSYLTHLKRSGHVERRVSSDKVYSWWRLTATGRKATQ